MSLRIKADELIKKYKQYGADIENLVDGINEFSLFENEDGLLQWTPTVTGDANFYSQLAAANDWYYSKNKGEYEYAAQWLDKATSVLEVGCGEAYFARNFCIPNYSGIEINDSAITKARAAGFNVIKANFNDYALQFPASMQRVFSFQVVEHLSDPYGYFRSAAKILKKDGYLITAVPSEDSFLSFHPYDALNCPPHHITRWTDHCLKTLPEKYGFKCIEIHHIPVEPIHQEWFAKTLLKEVFLSGRTNAKDSVMSKKQRISTFILEKIANLLISGVKIPEGFNIPGHTVVGVHQRI